MSSGVDLGIFQKLWDSNCGCFQIFFDCYGIRTRAGLAFFSLSGYPQATKQENQIERTLSAEEEIQIPRIEDIWDFHGFIYLTEQ